MNKRIHIHLPVYFGDVSALHSLTATLFSISSGDAGEFCDELGTACVFGDKILSDIGSHLLGIIGDDAFSGGDIGGDRSVNVLF